jgi:hypothetical protein
MEVAAHGINGAGMKKPKSDDMVFISATILPRQRAFLEREAMRRTGTMSLVIRQAIDLYIEANPEVRRKRSGGWASSDVGRDALPLAATQWPGKDA